MKRNVVQLMLGLAAMAVVLVGLESQANAFGHGSCGSNGGGGRHHRNHGSCGSSGGQSSCESSCSSCEQSSSSSCESSCGSCGGRRHHHHGGCNSGCGSSCNSGCESGCSSCGGGSSDEGAAPAAPEDRHERHDGDRDHGKKDNKKEKSA
jgi:hypothetical protein